MRLLPRKHCAYLHGELVDEDSTLVPGELVDGGALSQLLPLLRRLLGPPRAAAAAAAAAAALAGAASTVTPAVALTHQTRGVSWQGGEGRGGGGGIFPL